MRDFLVQAAKVAESSDAAEDRLDDFQRGQVTAMECTLALSCAYVDCRRALNMLARRMAELEQESRTLKEAA